MDDHDQVDFEAEHDEVDDVQPEIADKKSDETVENAKTEDKVDKEEEQRKIELRKQKFGVVDEKKIFEGISKNDIISVQQKEPTEDVFKPLKVLVTKYNSPRRDVDQSVERQKTILHVYGTDKGMRKQDIQLYFTEQYVPDNTKIKWVDDSSCLIELENEETAEKVLSEYTRGQAPENLNDWRPAKYCAIQHKLYEFQIRYATVKDKPKPMRERRERPKKERKQKAPSDLKDVKRVIKNDGNKMDLDSFKISINNDPKPKNNDRNKRKRGDNRQRNQQPAQQQRSRSPRRSRSRSPPKRQQSRSPSPRRQDSRSPQRSRSRTPPRRNYSQHDDRGRNPDRYRNNDDERDKKRGRY